MSSSYRDRDNTNMCKCIYLSNQHFGYTSFTSTEILAAARSTSASKGLLAIIAVVDDWTGPLCDIVDDIRASLKLRRWPAACLTIQKRCLPPIFNASRVRYCPGHLICIPRIISMWALEQYTYHGASTAVRAQGPEVTSFSRVLTARDLYRAGILIMMTVAASEVEYNE